MKIVIDIDDELYDYICNNHIALSVRNARKVKKAIANGTLLPKGHKRLIEDNFEVGQVFDEEGKIVGYRYITEYDLDNAPTIIGADKESD